MSLGPPSGQMGAGVSRRAGCELFGASPDDRWCSNSGRSVVAGEDLSSGGGRALHMFAGGSLGAVIMAEVLGRSGAGIWVLKPAGLVANCTVSFAGSDVLYSSSSRVHDSSSPVRGSRWAKNTSSHATRMGGPRLESRTRRACSSARIRVARTNSSFSFCFVEP